jgi:hypothetical protein
MTKRRFSIMLMCGLLFAVGLLLCQQVQRSKFEKYTRQSSAMDVAVLRANIEVVRSYMSIDVPTIYYDSSCACFVAHAIITSESMKEPLDQVRGRLMGLAFNARRALEIEFPELSKAGTSPDRDFRMKFFELNTKNTSASRDLAEYVDGKIVFNLDYAHGGPSERRPRLVDVIQN